MPDRFEVEQRDGCQAIYEHLGDGSTRIAALITDTSGDMVARLVATANVALSQHRRSASPAYGVGSGDAHRQHYCAGLCQVSIDHDTVYEPWPCFPHLAIKAALTGTTVSRSRPASWPPISRTATPAMRKGPGRMRRCVPAGRAGSRLAAALREALPASRTRPVLALR